LVVLEGIVSERVNNRDSTGFRVDSDGFYGEAIVIRKRI
jgi:hypothetical protein